ncbi:type II toxin-antitoxin system VapC family toxin [Algoriphagus boritolerans]|uniref:Ribonuclease VapC n=1 Tax=Algoriphagus boritolerans DSM 17298 = JCM 18970 TaxID=1120964 RepID=A0A1H6ASZ3_9BACT|nr:type II toxin-antitoxin system VapC family toxin [Algoriphagus boritolerans]SEG51681.1 tRNA(fMet)-specific endonuclease VapC [Algoriphagus boritolerans DSM 17298 = JCM 18970]
MKYLLDTNICIHFLRGKFGMMEKFQELGTENFAISEVTFAELVFGAENSTNPKKNLELIEVFTDQVLILPIFSAIYLYGKEKARLRSIGLMISDFDLLIGCTAVDKDLIMVTENQKEFERISGIQLENWVKR